MIVDLRPRTADDLDGCVRALAEVQRADRYPVSWPTNPGRWLTPRGLLEAWVAVAGGAVVGHAAIQDGGAEPELVEAVDVPADRLASVSRLFVTPPARGHGVGARLFDTVGRYAVEHGRRLVLTVAENGRAAIRLYERAGWIRVVSTPVDWLTIDGRPGLVHHYLSPDPTPPRHQPDPSADAMARCRHPSGPGPATGPAGPSAAERAVPRR